MSCVRRIVRISHRSPGRATAIELACVAPLLALMLGSAAGWAEHRLLEGRLQRIARHAAAAALVGGDAAARLELAKRTGDEEALQAASAVGDDTIQRKSTGRVVPDSFTHGSAAQRQRWFKTGFETGSVNACDTFSAANP